MGSSWFVNLSRALVQNSRSSNFPPKSIHFRHFYIVWDHSDHSGLSLSWASWVIMVRSPLCKIWILVAWMLLPSFQNILDLSSQHGKLKQCRLIPRIAAEKQRGQVTVTCLPLHLPACARQNDAECILKSRRIKDAHLKNYKFTVPSPSALRISFATGDCSKIRSTVCISGLRSPDKTSLSCLHSRTTNVIAVLSVPHLFLNGHTWKLRRGSRYDPGTSLPSQPRPT